MRRPRAGSTARPRFARPYLRLMRLDRPIGVWLLFWPCVFGLALGATATGQSLSAAAGMCVLCGIGAVVMRGAGCTYNDIVDRDFDAQVERTRGRPIPVRRGERTRGVDLCNRAELASVSPSFSSSIASPFCSAWRSLLLIAAYPFMKRITWWPQAWLGLTFNWGVLFGYAAMTGTLALGRAAVLRGLLLLDARLRHIYAHQDKEDDVLIGVRSAAIRLGARSKPWLYVFYAAAFVLMIAGGLAAGLRIVFALSMLVAGAHLLWQLHSLDIDRPLLCLMLFKSNRDTGALIAAALILGSVARRLRRFPMDARDSRALHPRQHQDSSIRRSCPRCSLLLAGEVIALWGETEASGRRKGVRLARAAPALLGVRLARRTGARALHPRQSRRGARPYGARFRRRLGSCRHRRGESRRVVRRGSRDRSARARRHRLELARRTAFSSSRSAVDIIGSNARWNTILAGDMCYERPSRNGWSLGCVTLVKDGVRVLSAIRDATIFQRAAVLKLASLRGADIARSRRSRDARNLRLSADGMTDAGRSILRQDKWLAQTRRHATVPARHREGG